jgi:hypothetical protein
MAHEASDLLSSLSCEEITGIIAVSSDVTDYTLIRFLHSLDAAEKMGVK